MATIQLTDKAREQFLAVLRSEEEPGLAVRLTVTGRGPRGFQYALDLMKEGEGKADDVLIDHGEFKMFVDPDSAKKVDGATIDWVQRGLEAGFRFDNPNALWDDPVAQRVQEVLDAQINPTVAMHGGFVSLLDVKGDAAYIALGGGCQGCGMADVTLKQGIEVMIREAVPEIHEVYDTTDHAAGTNPYYQPAKGAGPSPFG